MDSWTANDRDVSDKLALIKAKMPDTYRSIVDRVDGVTVTGNGGLVVSVPRYGKPIYALVRRGLRGEPNCFWAMERGHVVGTPFAQGLTPDVAQLMVQFGCAFVCIFKDVEAAKHGPH